jgi:hypothetical protein
LFELHYAHRKIVAPAVNVYVRSDAHTGIVPHAVIRVSAEDRKMLAQDGLVSVRIQFASEIRRCFGYGVVLYQSSRQRSGSAAGVGYFAMATVVGHPSEQVGSDRCTVALRGVVPLEGFLGMLEDGVPIEEDLLTAEGKFKGRRAALDVREISDAEFERLVRGREANEQAPLIVTDQPPIRRIRARRQTLRNAAFSSNVYQEYRGLCAISKIELLGLNGYSGLQAAHIFPYEMEPHDEVCAGILLAPSWHERFDNGAITIHEDYTWSANISDSETDAIKTKTLSLPFQSANWPDLELLRRKNALFRIYGLKA